MNGNKYTQLSVQVFDNTQKMRPHETYMSGRN